MISPVLCQVHAGALGPRSHCLSKHLYTQQLIFQQQKWTIPYSQHFNPINSIPLQSNPRCMKNQSTVSSSFPSLFSADLRCVSNSWTVSGIIAVLAREIISHCPGILSFEYSKEKNFLAIEFIAIKCFHCNACFLFQAINCSWKYLGTSR